MAGSIAGEKFIVGWTKSMLKKEIEKKESDTSRVQQDKVDSELSIMKVIERDAKGEKKVILIIGKGKETEPNMIERATKLQQ